MKTIADQLSDQFKLTASKEVTFRHRAMKWAATAIASECQVAAIYYMAAHVFPYQRLMFICLSALATVFLWVASYSVTRAVCDLAVSRQADYVCHFLRDFSRIHSNETEDDE